VANEISENLHVGYRLCSGHVDRVSHYLLAYGIPHSLHGEASHARSTAHAVGVKNGRRRLVASGLLLAQSGHHASAE
jgi:hypothetical protein